MPKDTPSMAKNKMRRCLTAILDPHPSAVQVVELWNYFHFSCAYCGIPLDRIFRNGHLDHVVPAAAGGSNEIHNSVLSCHRCNGDEKREEEWQSFLSRKVANDVLAERRHAHISAWIEKGGNESVLDPFVRAQAESIIAEALADFDKAVKKLRLLRL